MKRKTASTIICQNFKIPHQTIFQDYKCSYKSSLTYFGRLYIGEDHVCFIANMFGILKKCVIEIQRIQKLQQPSKNCLFIEEKQNGSSTVEFNFSGFKTDHAYTLIKALWKKQKIQSEVLNSNDDEQSCILSGSESDANKQKLIDQGNVESSFFNPKAMQAEKQKLFEFQLPCSVQQYYAFFLADNASVYSRRKHLQLRDSKQITITPWKKSQQLDSEVRQINAQLRVFGVPFMNYAHMSQVWKMKRKENNEIQYEIVTQMGDVPYSNYFVVNLNLNIIKDGETKCKMIVQLSIVFSKSTYMKNTILTRTMSDMVQDFNFWFNQVKTALQKMRKSQQAQNSLRSSKNLRMSKNASSDIQFQTQDTNKAEQLRKTDLSSHLSSKDKHKLSQSVDYNQIKNLTKKIDSLTKMVKITLFLVVLLILINIVSVWKIFQTKKSISTSYESSQQMPIPNQKFQQIQQIKPQSL